MIDLEVSVDASLRHSRGVLFFWWRNPPFLKVKFLTWHKHVIIFPYLLHYCPLYYIRSYIQGLFHKIFQSLRIIEYKKLQKHNQVLCNVIL